MTRRPPSQRSDLSPTRWIKGRLLLTIVALFSLFGVVGWRAYRLQIVDGPHLKEMAEQQYLKDIKIPSKRGTIFDRQGAPLAISVDIDSIYANPRVIGKRAGEVARSLAAILDLDPEVEALPPIFPLVLYNGDQAWTAPLQIADLADPLAREHLAAYVPTYAFHLIDEHAFPQETLELAANFISVIFTVETAKAEELTERLDPAVRWLHSLAHTHLDSAQRVLDWIRIRFHQDNRRAGEIRIQDIATPEELESMLDRTIR